MPRKDFNMSLADMALAENFNEHCSIPVPKNGGEFRDFSFSEFLIKAEKFSISKKAVQSITEDKEKLEKLVLQDFALGLRLPFPTTWIETEEGHENPFKYGFLCQELPLKDASPSIFIMACTTRSRQALAETKLKTLLYPASVLIETGVGKTFDGPLKRTPQGYSDYEKFKPLMEKAEYKAWIFRTMLMLSALTYTGQRVLNIGASRPPGKFYFGGKFRPYFSHRVVDIILDAPPQVRADGNPTGIEHRAHMVRGFYRSRPGTKDKSIFVESHQRGNAALGWVKHSYDVHTEDEHDGE